MIYLVSNVVVLGLLLFLTYILAQQAERGTNARTFLFVLISMLVWTFSHLVIQEFASIEEVLTPAIAGRLTYVGGLGLSVGVVIFAYYFPYKLEGAKTISWVLSGVFAAGALISLTTPLVFDTRYGDYGVGYIGALGFLAVLLVWSLVTLSRKIYMARADTERRQLVLLVVGLSLTVGWGVSTNILVPILTGSDVLGEYGPLGIVFMAIFTIYAIFTHRLFNIRLLVAEVFLGVIAIVLLILLATSDSLVNLSINGVTLGVYFVVAYYLYRELLARYEKEQELAEKNAELRRILETKDDFLRMVSHQLRTPMTSLSGFLSMLVDKDNPTYELNEPAYRRVVRVHLNTQRLSSVVNDILFTNALNAKKFGINIREINIREILEGVLDNKEVLSDFYDIEVISQIQGENFDIRGDPMKLKEALNTLIENAVYYGDTRALVTLEETERNVRIIVEDDGIGITPEEKECVWGKFKRSEEAKRRVPNSSGLALYVTRETVRRHGGEMWFESEGRDTGATFGMELPKEGPEHNSAAREEDEEETS